MTIRILSGGAAKGVVTAIQPAFTAETGHDIDGLFSAVGAMKEKFLAGDAADILILAKAQIDDLVARGLIMDGAVAPLGAVPTGIAVKNGAVAPDTSSSAGLKAALLAARGIYMPDPEKATAGIHFAGVMKKLGISEAVAPYLRPFPNGETAMRHLSQSDEENAIGCTQITEIKYTPGITLISLLPQEHDLSTIYTAAISAKTGHPNTAQRLFAMLTGPESKDIREQGGFKI